MEDAKSTVKLFFWCTIFGRETKKLQFLRGLNGREKDFPLSCCILKNFFPFANLLVVGQRPLLLVLKPKDDIY